MNDYNIGKLMEEMEIELIVSMKKNLSRHLKEEDKVGFEFPQWQAMKLKEMKRYQRENKSIIDNYTKGLNKDISNHLKKELTQGSKNSIKEYNGFASNKIKSSKMLNKSFFKTNDRKINSLIKVVNNDLKIANTSALRMINDEYRQVIHKSAFFLANGVVSLQKAIDMATKDFLARGLNCIEYKDGRRVNIASYSQMSVRTASLRAQLMGDGNFRESIGRHLVIATASNAACPLCSKWEDKVMIDDVYSGGSKKDGNYPLLSEAMKQGFLHPNCRDGVATYYPELDDINKSYENGKNGSESDATYQDDLNYINQQIKKYTRLELGSIDEDNIQNYRKRRIFYETKKEEVLIVRLPYEDLTEQLKNMSGNPNPVERRLNYSIDGDNIRRYDFFFEKDKDLIEEIECQKKIEEKTGYKVYLNPKTHTQNKKTPDFWIEDINELWDLKGIDGDSESIIDNILSKACKKKQTPNLILKQRETALNNNELNKQLKFIFDKNYKKYIKQVVLIDKKYNIIAYYKR